MKKQISVIFLMLMGAMVFAQAPSFSLSTNKDTVLMGHTIKVQYVLKQATTQNGIETPVFDHFRLVSGPNTSTSVSYLNGDMTRVSSYTYYLKADSPGVWSIPAMTIQTKEGELSTEEKQIVVLPNPEGTVDEMEAEEESIDFPFFRNTPPSKKPPKRKPKRKLYRL